MAHDELGIVSDDGASVAGACEQESLGQWEEGAARTPRERAAHERRPLATGAGGDDAAAGAASGRVCPVTIASPTCVRLRAGAGELHAGVMLRPWSPEGAPDDTDPAPSDRVGEPTAVVAGPTPPRWARSTGSDRARALGQVPAVRATAAPTAESPKRGSSAARACVKCGGVSPHRAGICAAISAQSPLLRPGSARPPRREPGGGAVGVGGAASTSPATRARPQSASTGPMRSHWGARVGGAGGAHA